MARKYKFCIRCRRTITDPEIAGKLYRETPEGLLCNDCAGAMPLPEEPPAPPEQPRPPPEPAPAAAPPVEQPAGEDPVALLASIRNQVESIYRLLMFERASAWNVMGGVAQCFAAGLLVMAALQWLENPANLLLAALVLQVMALTFFVKGK